MIEICRPQLGGNLSFQREPGGTVSGNHLLATIHKEVVMKKWSIWLASVTVTLLLAPTAFAQGTEPAGSSALGLLGIAAAFGMGIAAFGCGLGQGRIASAACEGIARNPGAAKNIFTPMILGLVFVETLVLFTFLMILIKVKT